METLDCIKKRRSVRKYLKTPVAKGVIKEIIDAGTHAPSSGNLQNWEFIVVTNPETKKKIKDASYYDHRFIEEAPALIVICSDTNRISKYGERGRDLYSIQNVSAAAENIMLAAWDIGLGSCWVGAFDETEVANAIVLPSGVRPMIIITLGYPNEKPEAPKRWGLDQVLHWERY